MSKTIVHSVQKVTRAKKAAPLINSPYRQQQAIKKHFDFSKKTRAGRANRKAQASLIKAGRKKPTYKAGLQSSVKYHVTKAKQLGTTYYR